jgi:hypothetical protein
MMEVTGTSQAGKSKPEKIKKITKGQAGDPRFLASSHPAQACRSTSSFLASSRALATFRSIDATSRPLCLDSLQVPADRAAVYIDFLGDLGLKLSLQIQAGNRFAPLGDAELVLLTPAVHVRSLGVRSFFQSMAQFRQQSIPLPFSLLFPASLQSLARSSSDFVFSNKSKW